MSRIRRRACINDLFVIVVLSLKVSNCFYLNNAAICMQNVTKTSSCKLTICFNLTLESFHDIELSFAVGSLSYRTT
jgi:hypothetical protein